MPLESYISSIVVRCETQSHADIAKAISSFAEVDLVPTEKTANTLIAVIDTPNPQRTLDIIDTIRLLSGVYSVNMIYNHVESGACLDDRSAPLDNYEDKNNEILSQTVY